MLSIKSLSFSFKHRPLFKDVSFEVGHGDVIHLTGDNGVGKSTFMSVLAGFRTQTSGDFQFNQNEHDDFRTIFEYLSPEANGLYLKMDAMQNLTFWSGLRGLEIPENKIIEELTYWGLGHDLVRKNFAVEKFSTGMRRRLALARVHLSPAKLWFLDEPIYGLDTKGINNFREIVNTHKNRGGSCIIISHDTKPLEGLITQQIPLRRL